MCCGPVLQQLDFGKKFYLQADASLYGVGAVLSQEGEHLTPSLAKQQKPILHPIAYYSTTFTQTKCNYNIYERELLAVMKALTHWRQYLGWTKELFVIMTDHANLQYWKSPKNLNQGTAQWQADLQEYDYKIWHISGKDNIPPDTLFRPPGVDQGKNNNQQQIAILPEKFKATATSTEKPMTMEMKRAIMLLTHDHPTAGHPGHNKTIRKTRTIMTWNGMNDWIMEYIEGCATCQQNKIQTHKEKVPPFCIGTQDNALLFQQVAMDLITGLPTHKGKDAILTIVDQGCLQATIFLPCMTNITGEGITQRYMDHVYRWYGLPTKVISNRDPRFMLHFGKSLAWRLGIEQNLSTVFHPQTDSLSEWKNQWVEQYLCLVTSTSPEARTDWISITTAIHNNRRDATTKLSPNQILLGYETKQIPGGTGESTNKAMEQQLETMIENRLVAINTINQMAKTRAPIPSQHKCRDHVWLEVTHLKLQHQKTKLIPKQYGPFKVIKEILYPQLCIKFSYTCHGASTTSSTPVTPSGEAGQWGPRPSHCGHWHWTVMADLSPVWFRVVLRLPSGQLNWLFYVPIRGLPLELRCPVAMTLIPLLVISGDFCLQYGLGLVLVVVLYGLGLPSGFLSCYYTVWDCLLPSILSTILVWDCLLVSFSKYYRSLGLPSF